MRVRQKVWVTVMATGFCHPMASILGPESRMAFVRGRNRR